MSQRPPSKTSPAPPEEKRPPSPPPTEWPSWSENTAPPWDETWKEETELPPTPPSSPLAFSPLPYESQSRLDGCVLRLLQAQSHGFCRLSKQQWGRPSPQQKAKLLEAHPHARMRALLECLEQKANPQLPEGQTLWPPMEAFFEQPLHPQLKSLTHKLALFSSLADDLLFPNNILPEYPSITTMASLHQEFARDFPVEYTRAFCSLCGPTGESTMLGGAALRLAESAPFVFSSSVSSALMEATFYGYLLQRSAFNSLLSKTLQNNPPSQRVSLSPWLLPPLIRQLFGISYESETFWSPQDASAALLKLAPLHAAFPNRPIFFFLGTQEKYLPEKQQAVAFETVRAERVFFRNNIGKLFSLPSKNFALQASSLSFPT